MFLSREHCHACGMETAHFNGRCGTCSDKEHAKSEAEWKALSVEDKIEILRTQIQSIRDFDRIIK